MAIPQINNLDDDLANTLSFPFTGDTIFKRLPKEIANDIIKRSFDCTNMKSSVCRRFRQILNRCVKYWRYTLKEGYLPDHYRAFPHLSCIEIRHQRLGDIKALLEQLKAHRIEEVAIYPWASPDHPTEALPLEGLKHLTCLKKIKLIGTKPSVDHQFCSGLSTTVTSLTFIEIIQPFKIPFAQNLTHLDVLKCQNISTANIPFSSLSSLRWKLAPQLPEEKLSALFLYDTIDVYSRLHEDKEWTSRFLAAGGDVDLLLLDRKCTCLFWSCFYAAFDRMQVLVKYGANVNARNIENNTPLHVAADEDHFAKVRFLIDAGANVNAKNNDGSTPLHLIDHLAATRYLLATGANPNTQNNAGNTPLHTAVLRYKKEKVKLLIAAGANGCIRNNKGQTAMDLAKLDLLNHEIRDILKLS